MLKLMQFENCLIDIMRIWLDGFLIYLLLRSSELLEGRKESEKKVGNKCCFALTPKPPSSIINPLASLSSSFYLLER